MAKPAGGVTPHEHWSLSLPDDSVSSTSHRALYDIHLAWPSAFLRHSTVTQREPT